MNIISLSLDQDVLHFDLTQSFQVLLPLCDTFKARTMKSNYGCHYHIIFLSPLSLHPPISS